MVLIRVGDPGFESWDRASKGGDRHQARVDLGLTQQRQPAPTTPARIPPSVEMGINPPRDAARAEPDPDQDQTPKQKAKQMTDLDEQFYDEASNDFPGINDLITKAHNMIKDEVPGRLVAIWADKNGRQQKKDGTDFPYTEGLVLVLDDGPDGDQFTDLIGKAPQEERIRFSTGGTHTKLAPRVDGWTKAKRDEITGEITAPSVPQRFRPLIGRINGRPSTTVKNGSPAINIAPPTPEDKPIIQRYKTQIMEINERLENKATEAEDAQAFG